MRRSLLLILIITSVLITSISCELVLTNVVPTGDNVAQPIVPTISSEISTSKNFYIIVDGSGSMGESAYSGTYGTRLKAAKWAISKFVSDIIPSDANIGLYSFDANGNRERVPIGNDNKQTILSKVNELNEGDNTPLNNAIQRATDALNAQKQRQLGYGYYYIVVITDGQATDGDVINGVSYANKYQIPIITIGYGISNEHALTKYSVSYRNANDPNTLFEALKETQSESTYYDATTFKN